MPSAYSVNRITCIPYSGSCLLVIIQIPKGNIDPQRAIYTRLVGSRNSASGSQPANRQNGHYSCSHGKFGLNIMPVYQLDGNGCGWRWLKCICALFIGQGRLQLLGQDGKSSRHERAGSEQSSVSHSRWAGQITFQPYGRWQQKDHPFSSSRTSKLVTTYGCCPAWSKQILDYLGNHQSSWSVFRDQYSLLHASRVYGRSYEGKKLSNKKAGPSGDDSLVDGLFRFNDG